MGNTGHRLVTELKPAESLDQVFLISQPQLRTTTRGDYYIAAYLSDRTGRLNGRMWQASEAIFKSLPQEGFVRVRGRTENYQGSLQLVIDSMRPVDEDSVDAKDFMPATTKDVGQMFARLNEILGQIKNTHLSRLTKAFLEDSELMALFQRAPAAKVLHHAYLGGLLEHTLSIVEIGLRVADYYPRLDADLLLVGLFLHDIGKTLELEYKISFQYSDQGRLLGHLIQGPLLIQQKIAKLDEESTEAFPATLRDSLMHIIVSHHGVREFGCPVLPATPEAFAVHHIDNLDSKIALVFSEIDKDPNDTDWTNYVRALEGPVFKVRPSTE